jgi:hypothetical protein
MILNKAAPLNAEVVMNKNSRFLEKMRFILGILIEAYSE